MNSSIAKSIWPHDTGIQDITADPDDLAASEIVGIKAIWKNQQSRLKGTKQLANFTEKLSREWAIETGILENLYDIERGVTQTLIERGFQAELLTHGSTNKPREYVIQLLNDQKEALEGVFDFVKSKRPLSSSYIKELHAVLLRSQKNTDGVDSQGKPVKIPLLKGDWKKQPNSPVRDGVTFTYCPPEQVASEMDRLMGMHEKHVEDSVPTEVQAAWLHHRFTQIHPFQDGNGRVARALASLVLVKDGLFPLVVPNDKKNEYMDALESADRGELKPLIDLIVKFQAAQFTKASSISEQVLIQDDVDEALSGLLKAADKIAADKLASLRDVFNLAHTIENNLKKRLEEIAPTIEKALIKVSDSVNVFANQYNENTSHYYRSQIIENAKRHLHYFADPTEYRSWVALHMRWSRSARLVFAFHGLGKPFNGSLICAPFLEFLDSDEADEIRHALVPLVDEGFIFFYNENGDRLIKRLLPWRERVLKVALKELTDNL